MRTTYFLLPLLATLVSGCQSVSYYAQAIRGQYEMLARRRPISSLLRDPQTPPALQGKLELVLELREFAARELDLPVGGSYLHYADLDRRFAVWNLHVAPELSLKPKKWFYPFIGRLSYRGYFSHPEAFRYGTKLHRRGSDVHIAGVETYSTLGWFKDPVLNTFIDHSEPALAEILFHELAHQELFVSGDTDFNEAFATAVAQEGARRWLEKRGDMSGLNTFEIAVQRESQFVDLVMETRRKLKAMYGDTDTAAGEGRRRERNDTQQRAIKPQILNDLVARYARLKAEWNGYSGYDTWFSYPLNNAQLNSIATYYDLVPEFQELLAAHQGDLPAFYQAVHRLRKLPKQERHRLLRFGLTDGSRSKASEIPRGPI